MNERMNQDWMG